MIDPIILSTLIITSLASAIIGVFLVLRNMSMVVDAITHTVLLGIVIAFIFTSDLKSPYLIVGATIMGVITVYLIELLVKSKRVKEDSAIGTVFPLLFSIAILIITLKFRNVHLDVHMVLSGDLTLANEKTIFIISTVLIINILFILIFYKELKISSFDFGLAKTLGLFPTFIHYAFMTLVSLTTVASFETVGSIAVIALIVGPAMISLLFTKNIKNTFIISVIISLLNSLLSYFLSITFDFNYSATLASLLGIIFIICLFLAPKGVISELITRNKKEKELNYLSIILHINNHEKDNFETNILTICNHLNEKDKKLCLKLNELIYNNYLYVNNNLAYLTDKGKTYLKYLQEKYNLS